ncbi:bifunctional UDP-sugar hydrolase/5'-nucleotidase UshA [Halomonas beimenensis]|uniref:UDP-sugar hydrolase/5'-nucleotidase n=1 Tax=Halomonas beimenensis TaxID=475662 RepID=A0A291P9N9_9GAMM|nr:bifunctional UDP-sugar hydrolase/5'-nucleotidase UshA [Halomonas beimenensis]ATJ83594.1 UDP-sugar hydrolase/5'-nucleotidase [Halomonas beimenensis]
MRHTIGSRALLAGMLLLLGGCATPAPETTYRLTILHTNDHHGRFWRNARDEYGMAARKTLVDRLRSEVEAEGGRSLLLSGGDINTGVPESDLLDAEPDFKGMNLLGYDAMAVGNHEFDNPLAVLRRQEAWADFPLLSANIYRRSTGQRLFPAYELFELEGLEVAVLGLTTDDTAVIGNPEYLADIEFRDPVEEAAKLVPELRERADLVIAVTHMGHYADARHGANAPGDVTLARRVPGIDLVVGGHSQEPVCMAAENRMDEDFVPGDACVPDVKNGTLIVQAHEWGKYVGRADLVYRDGELDLERYRLLPVNLLRDVRADGGPPRRLADARIPEDDAMLALLAPFQEKGQRRLEEPVGQVRGRLEGDRDRVRFEQTNLGRLIATAQATATGADLAIVNSGGIRHGLPEGPVTYRDILQVQPFGNRVAYVDLSGRELQAYLETLTAMPTDSGAYVQFGQVSFAVKDGELRDLVVYGNGETRVEASGTYRLALNTYSAAGGDGYPPLSDHPRFVDTGVTDAEVLKRFIARHSPIEAAAWQP